MSKNYDLAVIGAGSGGMASAKKAASHGASVALVEERTVGGTCVARGCMPKKFLFLAAQKMRYVLSSGPSGFESEPHNLDWTQLIDHEQNVVNDLIGANHDGVEKYENIDLIEGYSVVEDERILKIDDRKISFDKLIVASGMRPSRPPIDGQKYGITSAEFLQDHNLPNIMVIVGGGYIGVEFASVLNAFGVDVKIFQRPSDLIVNHDRDVARKLRTQLEDLGIEVYTDSEVIGIEKVAQAYRVTVEHESKNASYTTDRVLLATGREPNTDELNLENIGVELEDGFVDVDETFQTSRDHVYAVGDVNGEMPFTPVAIAEGKQAAMNAIENEGGSVNYDFIPTAVFSHPQIGSVGLSEDEARERFNQVEVAKDQFKPFEYAVRREEHGEMFIKLIYCGEEKRLMGLHVLGPDASEIVQGFALAMKKGIYQDDISDFPGIHPTLAEEVFSTKP